MSHRNMSISSIFKIWLRFNNKNLKLDHDMKSNNFGSLSIKVLTLKQLASF